MTFGAGLRPYLRLLSLRAALGRTCAECAEEEGFVGSDVVDRLREHCILGLAAL